VVPLPERLIELMRPRIDGRKWVHAAYHQPFSLHAGSRPRSPTGEGDASEPPSFRRVRKWRSQWEIWPSAPREGEPPSPDEGGSGGESLVRRQDLWCGHHGAAAREPGGRPATHRSTRLGWVTVSPGWFRATRTVNGRLGWSYPEPSRRVCDATRRGPRRADRGLPTARSLRVDAREKVVPDW